MKSRELIDHIIMNNPAAVTQRLAAAGLINIAQIPNGLAYEKISFESFIAKVRSYYMPIAQNEAEQINIVANFLDVQPLPNGAKISEILPYLVKYGSVRNAVQSLLTEEAMKSNVSILADENNNKQSILSPTMTVTWFSLGITILLLIFLITGVIVTLKALKSIF